MLVLAAEVGGTQCCNHEGKTNPVPTSELNCNIEEFCQVATPFGFNTLACGLGSKNCMGDASFELSM